MNLNKKSSLKLSVSAGLGILGIVLVLIVSPHFATEKTTGEPPFGAYSSNLSARHPPPAPLTTMYGNTVSSVSEASQLSGVLAKNPSYLPPNLELKMIKTKVQPENQVEAVTLIYAPKQISINETSTFEDVLDYNGMIIVQAIESSSFDSAKWVDSYGANTPGAKFITVHGAKAIGFDGDPTTGKPSQIIYFDGRTQVIMLSVAHQSAELLKTAESIQ